MNGLIYHSYSRSHDDCKRQNPIPSTTMHDARGMQFNALTSWRDVISQFHPLHQLKQQQQTSNFMVPFRTRLRTPQMCCNHWSIEVELPRFGSAALWHTRGTGGTGDESDKTLLPYWSARTCSWWQFSCNYHIMLTAVEATLEVWEQKSNWLRDPSTSDTWWCRPRERVVTANISHCSFSLWRTRYVKCNNCKFMEKMSGKPTQLASASKPH